MLRYNLRDSSPLGLLIPYTFNLLRRGILTDSTSVSKVNGGSLSVFVGRSVMDGRTVLLPEGRERSDLDLLAM